MRSRSHHPRPLAEERGRTINRKHLMETRRSQITAGAVAPLFRLPSAEGETVALEDYRGRKTVVLVFLRDRG
jgi:AhpC/TSA family